MPSSTSRRWPVPSMPSPRGRRSRPSRTLPEGPGSGLLANAEITILVAEGMTMRTSPGAYLAEVLQKHEVEIVNDWVVSFLASPAARPDLLSAKELHEEASQFLQLVSQAVPRGDLADITSAAWDAVRQSL